MPDNRGTRGLNIFARKSVGNLYFAGFCPADISRESAMSIAETDLQSPGYKLPSLGSDPSTTSQGTTPGSFANPPSIAPGRKGAMTFSSPDTPGMPQPSEKTAWDFMPEDWTLNAGFEDDYEKPEAWEPPLGWEPITQLEQARRGITSPEMKRVAEREPHLTSEQVRDEVAAGRMVIPANITHLKYDLDPMAIGRASKTKVNANMGA